MKKLLQAERAQTFLLALTLFLVNFDICHRLFRIEYLAHMGSIEGAYIGIARYVMSHWRDLTWFPLWYGGVPFQNTYPPFLHLSVALAAQISGASPAHAYHWVTALFYCLGPIALFALVLRLTESRWTAFAAGAVYSCLSISAWLIPAIATDMGGLFYPRRLQALVYYGEGPHVSGLTLLPVALLCLDLAITRRTPAYFALAVLSFAAAVLTNWLAAFGLAIMVTAYAMASIGKNLSRVLLLTAGISLTAYCLAMPWIPPSTIAVVQENAKVVGGDFRGTYRLLPLWGIVMLVGLGILKLLARRLTFALQFAIFFAFPCALLTLTYAWWNIAIVPQPVRYHLEMEMAFAILIAVAAHELLKSRPRSIAAFALAALVICLVQPIRLSRSYARNFLLKSIDISSTSEWKTAQWLNRNWNGERVMLPGSTSFWMTAFSDVPQLGGGFDQGTLSYTGRIAQYEISTGDGAGPNDGEFSRLWLEALGGHAVAVSGPASTEVYKPFRNPKKFDGILDPLWRSGDDVIYQVGPHASLARVVPRDALVMHPPINGIDVDSLRRYVAALDDPQLPEAKFQWIDAHTAQIDAAQRPDQAVSVQITWHPGWHAAVNGRAIPVEQDGLSQMVLNPHSGGPIRLIYDGGTEMRIAHVLSALAAMFLVAALARSALKRA